MLFVPKYGDPLRRACGARLVTCARAAWDRKESPFARQVRCEFSCDREHAEAPAWLQLHPSPTSAHLELCAKR